MYFINTGEIVRYIRIFVQSLKANFHGSKIKSKGSLVRKKRGKDLGGKDLGGKDLGGKDLGGKDLAGECKCLLTKRKNMQTMCSKKIS